MNSLLSGILYLIAVSFAITLFFSYFLKKDHGEAFVPHL